MSCFGLDFHVLLVLSSARFFMQFEEQGPVATLHRRDVCDEGGSALGLDGWLVSFEREPGGLRREIDAFYGPECVNVPTQTSRGTQHNTTSQAFT